MGEYERTRSSLSSKGTLLVDLKCDELVRDALSRAGAAGEGNLHVVAGRPPPRL